MKRIIPDKPLHKIKKENNFVPVVAIGTSAGGQEAMAELLSHLSSDTGMAYVYIQHLSPYHEKALPVILSKATRMNVQEAKNRMPVNPNNIYVIPTGKDMTIENGLLKLISRQKKPALHLPIDRFFISLAEKNKQNTISILLPGSATDGILGLKAIKASGGLAFVQDDSAKFQSMPQSAILEEVVDLVLSPVEMAKELERLSNKTGSLPKVIADGDEDDYIGNENESVLVLDRDLRVKKVNKSFYETFHLKEKNIEGQLLYELGNGQWNIPVLLCALEEVTAGNTYAQDIEIRHTFQQAGEKIMLLNIRKITRKIQQQELFLIAIEDITEHKQSEKVIIDREEWFRNMADSAPVMIWVSGTDKLCTFFNKTWLEYTGRNIDQELEEGWTEGVFPDDRDQCVQTYLTHFDERKPFQAEYRFRRYDGEYRWVMCNGKPSWSHTGEFNGYIGSVSDIHVQKTFSEELENRVQQRTKALHEANANLEHSNDELQQFAYVASHDLQEPLRKIITFSDRLQNRFNAELPDDAKKYLDKISQCSERMRRLIDDLLNFSKATKTDDLFEETDLNVILKKVLHDFDLSIHKKNAEIHAGTLPVIRAVPVEMIQLFHNLISNALKFSSSRSTPEITVSSQLLQPKELDLHPQLNKQKTYYRLIFKDNGIGFAPEFAEQIFIIFQRLNERYHYSGTGIGLALCRKIVNYHDGVIYAESKEKEGTSFHVILPVK